MKIDFYSKNNCPFCDATDEAFKREGMNDLYVKKNIEVDPSYRDYVISQGVSSMPYIEVTLDSGEKYSWSGRDPKKVAETIRHFKDEKNGEDNDTWDF